MALIKFGGGVVGMSGKIAGNVFARNRYGSYARALVQPVNPNSARQQAIRALASTLGNYWGNTLTAAQREGWNDYAANVDVTNRLGEVMNLSGFNHFFRTNSCLVYNGYDIVEDAPAIFSLADQPILTSVSGDPATQELSVAYDSTEDWANETGGALLVYAGLPQNPNVNFFDGPWRVLDSVDGDDTTPPTSPLIATCPFTIADGQKIWVKARAVLADGRVSEFFRISGSVSI